MTQKLRYFCTLLFMAVVGVAWAQSDYSDDYTGNVTLSTTGGTQASTCKVKIDGTDYDGIKLGSSKNAGAVKITVPAGTKYLHLHVAAWNNDNVTLDVTPTGYSSGIALTSNSGISNNSPFTFNGDPSTSDYYKVITFSEALTDNTDLTFTATGGKRFVVWGVTAEEEAGGGDTDTPSINTEDVNIDYDATDGAIAYTVNNPVSGGSVNATTTADWLTLSENFESPIAFTCEANETKDARTATVTLTYTYDNESVTKNVTVTQAGNPNVIDKIENISESGVFYVVKGTVVATSARGFVIGDGTGYVYTYLGSAPSYSVGDMVKISGTTSTYGNVIQFTSAAQITEVTESEYTPLTPAAMSEVPDYTSDLHKSDYYQFEGMLTKSGSNYVVQVGSGQIRISYPTTNQATALDDLLNNTVKVKGFFAGNSTSNNITTFTVIMESVEATTSPTITIAPASLEVAADATSGTFTVTFENMDATEANIQYCDEDGTAVNGYDWFTADFGTSQNEIVLTIQPNTVTETRTGYLHVWTYQPMAQSNVVSITQEAYVPKWTVSFNLDGGTFVANEDFPEEIVDVVAGTYTLPSATKENFILEAWYISGETYYSPGADYEVTDDVEFEAIWVPKGNEEWVQTELADLTENDVFVIVGNNGSNDSNFAMTNDNGASSGAPAVVAVTVEDGKIASKVNDNMMWNVSGNATDGYTFFVNGDSEKWLYCTTTAASGANNNMRVGTGDRKAFILDGDGYLVTKDNNVARYLSIYVNSGTPQDWRGYINTNSAVAIAFYKKVVPSTTATITIKANFPATTFSCDKALDFSNVEGITANIITDDKGTTKDVARVPANTGLYIAADETSSEERTFEIPILVNELDVDDVSENKLVATDGENAFKEDGTNVYYTYGKKNGKFAFYKIVDASATPSANKAVLAVEIVTTMSGAKDMIEVNGGDVTGIESIENGTENGQIFDLQGRKVTNAQKGVYIVNGRKVVVK